LFCSIQHLIGEEQLTTSGTKLTTSGSIASKQDEDEDNEDNKKGPGYIHSGRKA
jgi:hypothetical protein